MITEDYVSFETAKLLKEKGFDWECRAFWKEWNGKITLCHCSSAHAFEFCYNSMLENYNDEEETNIAAPTLQMAMKWLREIHNLEIYPYHNNSTIYNSKWWFEIIEYPNSVAEYESGKNEEFDTYEEACEAAIKYCLENLI